RAVAVDGDIDEFVSVEPLIPQLVAGRGGAEGWVERVRATAEKPYSNTGKALLHLTSRVAQALGDTAARAALLVAAVRHAAEDDALVEEADLAVHEHGDPELARVLDAEVKPAERALAHLRRAEEHEREGREGEAIDSLRRVIDSGELGAEAKARAS